MDDHQQPRRRRPDPDRAAEISPPRDAGLGRGTPTASPSAGLVIQFGPERRGRLAEPPAAE
jgi:hypothetical protein